MLRIDAELDEIRIPVPSELDLSTSKQLADRLSRACALQPSRVVLDLSSVTFCDLTTLRVLVAASDRLHDLDSQLELRSPPRTLQRLAQLLGLSARLGLPAD